MPAQELSLDADEYLEPYATYHPGPPGSRMILIPPIRAEQETP